MMIMNQNVPIVPVAPKLLAHNSFAASLDCHSCSTPAVCIRAGIDRIGQHVMQRVVDGRLPFDRTLAATRHNGRDEDALLPEPKQHLADRLQFREPTEDERDSILNPPIRIFLDAAVLGLHVADRDGQMKFAASCLLAHRLHRPLTEYR